MVELLRLRVEAEIRLTPPPFVVRVDDDVTVRHDLTTTESAMRVLAVATSIPPPRALVRALAVQLAIVVVERVTVLPSDM
eukprot:4338395-Prymnesium_polylepis.1